MSNSDKTEISNQVEFKLPKMGESITEGTILNWLVDEGEQFEEGDILVEVGTDKVDNEVPAPFSGKLIEIKFEANAIVKIGEVIAILDSSSPAPHQRKREQASSTKIKAIEKVSPLRGDGRGDVSPLMGDGRGDVSPLKEDAKGAVFSQRIEGRGGFYSPLVEKIAKDYHISYEELARIPASGAEGRLKKSDIFKYIEAGRPAQFAQPVHEPSQNKSSFQVPDLKFDKGEGKRIKMDRMRQMIADHMVFSKHTSPHVTAYVEADLTELVNWRNQNKSKFLEETGEKLTFTPLFIQAVTKAIQDFPRINSTLDGDEIIEKEAIHIGMATALPSGNLIVPVVKDTANKNLEEIAREVNRLVEKARNNQLTSDETKGSTFTISNVGTFGSLMGTPIINQPEAAILATGIIKKRAEVMEYRDGDKIEIRQMMYLSLSFDHRIVDGFLAGSFLRRIADYLEGY